MKDTPQTKMIKQAIVNGHRNGVCDSEGNSLVHPETGLAVQAYKTLRGKTYVYDRQLGRMVEK
jgi:hypothetical protein